MNLCDVTVVVGVFGGPEWGLLAERRAAFSARRVGVGVVVSHGDTLAQARQTGMERVETPFMVYLDADDELTPNYFQDVPDADVVATRITYAGVRGHVAGYPRVAGHQHDCVPTCLEEGNYVHIGAIVRTDLARKLQWHEHVLYEDYCYWLQAYGLGATFAAAPGVYRAHVRRDSRNRQPARSIKQRTHHEIASEHYPDRDWSYLLT